MKQLFLLIILFTTTVFAKQKREVLELIHANYNMNRMVDGAIKTELNGEVKFRYGTTLIYSDSTVWHRGKGVLFLKGSVVVQRNRQELSCDSLWFYSERKKFELRGNTQMIDSAREVTLRSREADYYMNEDSLEMRYDPKVWFWSSSDTDTVVLTGEPMHYLGKTGTVRVEKNMTITGRDIDAYANSGYYSKTLAKGKLRDSAYVRYGLSEIRGGVVELFVTGQQADSFTVVGEIPTGITRDTVKNDTTVNKLFGDSLHFTVDSNRIERVVSTNNARMEQFPPTRRDKADILWGDIIDADMFRGGGGKAFSRGNARSLYHSEDEMINEIAGDTLYLTYDSLGVDEITLIGAVQGVILPDDSEE